jgi:hypothetical protein
VAPHAELLHNNIHANKNSAWMASQYGMPQQLRLTNSALGSEQSIGLLLVVADGLARCCCCSGPYPAWFVHKQSGSMNTTIARAARGAGDRDCGGRRWGPWEARSGQPGDVHRRGLKEGGRRQGRYS